MQRRRMLELAAMAPILASCAANGRILKPAEGTDRVSAQDDFDFLIGAWRVHHRRLVSRLAGSDDWREFGGECRAWKVMGGQGNVDDNILDLPDGAYRALSLRSYDPQTAQWAIWWLDARNPHVLDVPVKGSFVDGVGTFLADDNFNGKPIKVRFLWLDTQTGSPRWEQAFSPDGGATWETNWVMQFARA